MGVRERERGGCEWERERERGGCEWERGGCDGREREREEGCE